MWKYFLECIDAELWIRLLLKTANQVVFLVLLVRFLHKKLHGTTSPHSLWKSMTVVCGTLLANYFIWPLVVHITNILMCCHNHWTVAIFLIFAEWTSNRWFSSSESQPPAVNLVTPEQCQRCPTLCHSQGDVAQKVNSKSTNDTNYVDIVNKSPPSRLPRVRYAENVTRLETQRSFNSIPPELCASPSSVKISTRSGRTYFRI